MKRTNEVVGEAEALMEIGRICRERGAGRTVYCLFREAADGNRFRIRVTDDSACEEGEVFGNLSCVTALFERIAKGEVPPYILHEILEDYNRENALDLVNI
ncbi:MAG: hypothetical protein E7606_05390 [Ruminococcaceae bacterium]|nr:hypothetical protein [Oscillospiraceae bacterium]